MLGDEGTTFVSVSLFYTLCYYIYNKGVSTKFSVTLNDEENSLVLLSTVGSIRHFLFIDNSIW